MNYDKVAKQLESPAVKLDMLARYAQGQNPAVPEFLALAEIKRRQSLTQHSPAPAQTTVQEDLTRAAMPQQMPQQMAGLQAMQRPQGVAALPTNMGEQAFAGGGIVAFAGDEQSLVEDDGLTTFEKFKRYINNLGGGVMPRGGAPVNALPGQVQAVRSGRGTGIPTTSAQAAAMLPEESNLKPDSLGRYIAGDESKLYEAERLAKNIAPQGQALPTVGERGRMAPTTEQAQPGTPKEDMYAKYEEMLKGQAAETKASREQDKYMRLLEAGLGIMGGTSPFASANIGQGAMSAAKGYAQDQAAARKEERENIKELMGLGMKKEEAEREAEKLAMTKELYKSHGKYYEAAAGAQGAKAAGAGAGTKLQIAQDRNAVALYNKWLTGNPMATPEEQNAAWLRAQQMAGAGGGAGVMTPTAAYSWSPKGGLVPNNS